ncbi:MAG: formamidopyrimidine-DNA glycosylase, partial [Thermoleophilia bacterium]|nr:formamidopyrimidine-DNA glycosylase [Thermoleophilia bacterium]
LFRAGISPRRVAARLTRAQCDGLRDAVREALTAGIDAKGASIDDFRDAYGVQGSFQDQFLVHRREGLPCPTCGQPVVKLRVAGRGTYFCRGCQTG